MPKHEMHQFIPTEKQGGYLSVTVERTNNIPVAIFRHHKMDGSVANEDIQKTAP